MVELRRLDRSEAEAAFDDLARLRIEVFREWPYLYEGDLDYERRYLGRFLASPGAVVIGAMDGARLVGAATASPLEDHFEDFSGPFVRAGLPTADIFYFGESLLRADYRGRGLGGGFFDAREAAALEARRPVCVFAAVVRPPDHPAQPPGYRALDGFWRRRGYVPVDGMATEFAWRDVGEDVETAKPMAFWTRDLRAPEGA